jgi:hypothetical protein
LTSTAAGRRMRSGKQKAGPRCAEHPAPGARSSSTRPDSGETVSRSTTPHRGE